jgi:hypothetical protein
MGKTSHKDIKYQDLLTQAVQLRLHFTPYDEIIAKLGHWKSISACQKAVAAFLKRNQIRVVEDSRAESIAILQDQIFDLRAKFKISKSIMVSREIRNLLREINLLQGNYAPTKIAETDAKGKDKERAQVIVYLPDNTRDK